MMSGILIGNPIPKNLLILFQNSDFGRFQDLRIPNSFHHLNGIELNFRQINPHKAYKFRSFAPRYS